MRRRATALALASTLAGAAIAVLSVGPAAAIPPHPSVSISPTSGPAGTDVTVSGGCGQAGPPGVHNVHLRVLDGDGVVIADRFVELGTTTDFLGIAFSEPVTVPASAAVGEYAVTYVCTNAFSPEPPFPTFTVTSSEAEIATVTTLTASPNPVPSNQSTTLTATVTAAGDPVTDGTVLFTFDQDQVAAVEVDDDGVATFIPTLPTFVPSPIGPPPHASNLYDAVATYQGDSTHLTSTESVVVAVRPPVHDVAAPTITTESGLLDFGEAIEGTAVADGASPLYAVILYYFSYTGGGAGVVLAECCVDGPGQWHFTLTEGEPLPAGIYAFVAQAVDGWGNFSPASNVIYLIVS